ncbi:hypothetical protein QQS21_005629 [Conoideocrella luteorostrata]|uniref:FAD-binding domain-containing protein n=1 Tax=Conoideocrella luteorostrata TaxID=1105319 RepID=A0AAJ0CP19_9HYPO|nr:hypothetical protein QQS21_005629 [Conoideocrella luteorostrata]
MSERTIASHGYDILLLERRQFLKVLYDGLQNKSRVQLGRNIQDIVECPSHVQVIMADETVEKGDMVIGCDGVHSMVRNLLQNQANKSKPGSITATEKTSIKTSWKCLIGVAGSTPEMGDRDMTDANDLAEQVADHPLSDSMVFGELWKRRSRGALIPLEQGVLENWHHGRMVLAGDAVHKVTPNIALGGNSAMESIAVLCNHINRMVNDQSGAKPSLATLNHTISAYRDERAERMKKVMEFSNLITKIQAWDTPLYRFVAEWIMPYAPDR